MTSRREFLKYAALLSAGTVIAGCAPKAEPAPAAAPAEKPVEKPAEVKEEKPAAKAAIELRYMERAGQLGDFMRYASRLYEEKNPGITVKNEPAGWGDLTTKVPTMVAAGTMADLAFQHGAYMLPTLGKKGVWLDMTPAAERDNHNFDIYYQWALDTCRLGPQDNLCAMPMGVHFGQNELHWNVEMIKGMGLDEPNDKMSKQQWLEWMIKVQEKLPESSFTMDAGWAGHFTSECHARSWGGYVVSPDRKTCGFDMPETQAAYKWGYDLIHEYGLVPLREQVQENAKAMFYAETMATFMNCSANVWVGFTEAVGDKFTLGHCVWPHADGEGWGTVPSCDATVIYGKTKYPDESWGLAAMLSGFEVSKWTAVSESHMTPGAVIEAWHDKDVWEACPPYKNCAVGWDTLKPEQYGNMGVPNNTRRAEFDDHFASEWQKIYYGEVDYTQAAVDKLQGELKAIMDKPVP
jgi:ABC-type glycerol-3-phosphate transport system substrate-binding protein